MDHEELFVRKLDELRVGLGARDDYEALKLAALLRHLLVDGTPLLHAANRSHRLTIRFSVASRPELELPIEPDVHFVNPLPMANPPGAPSVELNLDQFLSHEVLRTRSGHHTVRDIVQFAANKAGGVHHASRHSTEETELRRADALTKLVGMQLLLECLRSIATVAVISLEPLRQKIVRLPAKLPLIAHYALRHGAMVFDGERQFLETNDLALTLKLGFSWNGVIAVRDQPSAGTRFLYELGDSAATLPRISLSVSSDGELVCSAATMGAHVLEVRTAGFRASPLWGRFVFVSFELSLLPEAMRLALWLNNHFIAVSDGAPRREIRVDRHVIGADLHGERNAAFEIRELVLAPQPLSSEHRSKLGQYLWLQWHD